jgi:hypothetical protein
MKTKAAILILVLLAMIPLAGYSQNLVIFDFDGNNPASLVRFGYFYAYSGVYDAGRTGNGLDITVPAVTRGWGGGLDLNISPFMDLTAQSSVYGWIRSVTPGTVFTVAFELENNFQQYNPNGQPYTSYAAIPFDATNFTKVEFDLSGFQLYGGVTPLNPTAINQISWIFPDNTTGESGPDRFILDDVGSGGKRHSGLVLVLIVWINWHL